LADDKPKRAGRNSPSANLAGDIGALYVAYAERCDKRRPFAEAVAYAVFLRTGKLLSGSHVSRMTKKKCDKWLPRSEIHTANIYKK